MVDILKITSENFIEVDSGSKLIEINKPKFIEIDVWNIFSNRYKDDIMRENNSSSMFHNLVNIFVCINKEVADL